MKKQEPKPEEQSNSSNLEMQLLLEKIKHLETKVSKPKSTEEEYQERIAKYEATQESRDQLKAEIEARRMQIWQENPKMRQDEVILMEAWERRAKAVEASNPEFAAQLKYQMKMKVKEVNEAYDR